MARHSHTGALTEGWLAYGMAATVGLLFVARVFPTGALLGQTPDAMLAGDFAAHVMGQRYFMADSWRWPFLLTRLLEPPTGVNIAFTDSIPLTALPAKLLRDFLPHGFTIILPFLAGCFVAQPVSAVIALRAAGEARALPALATAVMAISTPALLFRCGQVALCAHFLILLALALVFRAARLDAETAEPARRALPVSACCALLAASLLIHPYLLIMVTAVLVAAPLSLLAAGQASWRQAARSLCLGCLVTAGLALMLGYDGKSPGGGFGFASMNLLAPVYPAYSFILKPLFPSIAGPMDATGGQFGGYQYLGLGLLLLLAAALPLAWRHRRETHLRRHAGLLCVCACLTLFALSNVIYAGHVLLVRLGTAPDFVNQLQASNRFFWPVTYSLLLASILAVARWLPYRIAAPLLLLCAAVQYRDATFLRGVVFDFTHGGIPAGLGGAGLPQLRAQQAVTLREGHRLRALLARHHRLTLWPTAACGTSESATAEFLPLLIAASDVPVPVNTMYVARHAPRPSCEAMDGAARPLAWGELRVLLPAIARSAPLIVPQGEQFCRALGRVSICSLDTEALDGLLPVKPGMIRTNDDLTPQAMEDAGLLGAGWSTPEPGGIWSLGHTALLAGRFAMPVSAPVTLTIRGYGFTGKPGDAQPVAVEVNGHPVAAWRMQTDAARTYSATIAPGLLAGGTAAIRFAIANPTRPIDAGSNADERQLGFFLTNVTMANHASHDQNPEK